MNPQIGLRMNEDDLQKLDSLRGGASRSRFLRDLVHAALYGAGTGELPDQARSAALEAYKEDFKKKLPQVFEDGYRELIAHMESSWARRRLP